MQLAFNLNEIKSIATELLQYAGDKKVLAFHGEMGAGKTTFIHALCEVMGVKDHVTSPTFSIINEYKAGTKSIYHLDLYRLKDEAEAINAGVEDCLYSGNTCMIEWPGIAASLIPDDAVNVYLKVVDTNTRSIAFE